MQSYMFVGPQRRFYPHWEEQSFYAEPGEIRAFENPPPDGNWIDPPQASKPAVKAAEEGK